MIPAILQLRSSTISFPQQNPFDSMKFALISPKPASDPGWQIRTDVPVLESIKKGEWAAVNIVALHAFAHCARISAV